MSDEKRMAGDYEIIHAIHLGDREVVVGENQSDRTYMTALCQTNELVAMYTDVMTGEYPEIMRIFGERIAAQAEKARVALLYPEMEGVDNAPLMKEDCTPITCEDNIEGKVIVIKPETLRPEHQHATYQLRLCTGGFGSHGNARGNACFCTELDSGRESRFERYDVMGVIEPDALPDWAKAGLESIRQAQQAEKKKSSKEAR